MSEIVFPSTKAGNEVDRAVTAALSTIPGQVSQLDTRVTALENDVDDLQTLPAQVATIGSKLDNLPIKDNNSQDTCFTDAEGNIGFKITSQGACAKKFNICDSNGNIVGTIDYALLSKIITNDEVVNDEINDEGFTDSEGNYAIRINKSNGEVDLNLSKWALDNSFKKQRNIDVVLPSVIPFVANKTINVYYDNILTNCKLSAIPFIQLKKFGSCKNYFDRLEITTSKATSSSECLWNNGFNIESKKVQFVGNNPITSGNLSLLIIGDSKVRQGTMVKELKDMLVTDGMSVEMLGTIGDAGYKNEGRNGWSTYEYCNNATYNSITNPFYNPSTNKFDFSYYMSSQGYSSVSVVCINLGTNDLWHVGDGLYTMEDVIGRYYEMVASIKAFSQSAKICIGLAEASCQREGNDYISGLYKKTQQNEWVQKLIDNFDNRQQEGLFLSPLYLNIDLMEDYDLIEVPLSSRDDVKTRLIPSDRIHQSIIGYKKNADIMYSTIIYALNY